MEEFEDSKMVREKAQTRGSNLLNHVAQVGFSTEVVKNGMCTATGDSMIFVCPDRL